MKHTIITLLIAVAAFFVVAGCSTETTVTEYDSSGKVTKTTMTERDIVDKITESTQGKLVLAWSNGWAAYIEAVMTEAESGTITPTGKIYAGKIGKGYLSIPNGFTCTDVSIADIIAATHENLSAGFTGVSAVSDNASASTTQTTTSAGTVSTTSSSSTSTTGSTGTVSSGTSTTSTVSSITDSAGITYSRASASDNGTTAYAWTSSGETPVTVYTASASPAAGDAIYSDKTLSTKTDNTVASTVVKIE